MIIRHCIPPPNSCRSLLAVAWFLLLAVPAWAQQPKATLTASHCGFLGQTLLPSLAMGVRRIDDPDIESLELRDMPDPTAKITKEEPLFQPFFVTATETDKTGGKWHRLQSDYTTAAPLGWASDRHVHLLQSRYAYTYAYTLANRQRKELADLQNLSKESYERLLTQSKGDAEGGKDKIMVRERPGAEHWQPVAIQDIVPFVELLIPLKERDKEHPDTTPTFKFGIPLENRLVHMGAVCGGPIDDKKLRELRATILVAKDLEMLFVVDETVSMRPFNEVVASFIRTADHLAANRPAPMKVAVCSYSDGPPGKRVTLGVFEAGPQKIKALADKVALLGQTLPPDDFANPPERMLEGLRDALRDMKFLPGGTPFVAVVGDTGHEPKDPDKNELIAEVARLIQKHSVRAYFMHVGRRKTPEELLFQGDFDMVQTAAVKLGVPKDHIVYEPAEKNNLEEVLKKSQDEVEAERRRRQQQIVRMESRTPYTEPGPKLLKALEARGIDPAKFDKEHLQYFVPSQGWLFHPSGPTTGAAQPQFRELFFLAKPERMAIKGLFDDIRDRLTRNEPIDGDAVIEKFAKGLAVAAGNSALESRVLGAWKKIPDRQRSVGAFLEDVFGLRLKAALSFPSITYAKDQPATQQGIARMLERIGRLGEAFKAGGDTAFWFDASSLVP